MNQTIVRISRKWLVAATLLIGSLAIFAGFSFNDAVCCA